MTKAIALCLSLVVVIFATTYMARALERLSPESHEKLRAKLEIQRKSVERLEGELEVERFSVFNLSRQLREAQVSTWDPTSSVTAEQLTDALFCQYQCEDTGGCYGPTDDLQELLIFTCGMGWHNATELINESERNLYSCQRELEFCNCGESDLDRELGLLASCERSLALSRQVIDALSEDFRKSRKN